MWCVSVYVNNMSNFHKKDLVKTVCFVLRSNQQINVSFITVHTKGWQNNDNVLKKPPLIMMLLRSWAEHFQATPKGWRIACVAVFKYPAIKDVYGDFQFLNGKVECWYCVWYVILYFVVFICTDIVKREELKIIFEISSYTKSHYYIIIILYWIFRSPCPPYKQSHFNFRGWWWWLRHAVCKSDLIVPGRKKKEKKKDKSVCS